MPGLSPTLQQTQSHRRRHGLIGNQARGQPHLSPTTYSSQPCHNRRGHTAHIGGTLRTYWSSNQRGVCCWAPWDISYIRPLLQDQETEPTYLMHRNKHRKLSKNGKIEENVPNEGTRQNLRKNKRSGHKQSTSWRVQGKDHCEFLGGPVVRTWRFHCCGPGSIPGQGTKIPKPRSTTKKKR